MGQATRLSSTRRNIQSRTGYWSPLWERWMVSDRMQWHIAKVGLMESRYEEMANSIRALKFPSRSPSRSTTREISAQASRWLSKTT
jgi:hypothetical protein